MRLFWDGREIEKSLKRRCKRCISILRVNFSVMHFLIKIMLFWRILHLHNQGSPIDDAIEFEKCILKSMNLFFLCPLKKVASSYQVFGKTGCTKMSKNHLRFSKKSIIRQQAASMKLFSKKRCSPRTAYRKFLFDQTIYRQRSSFFPQQKLPNLP